MKKVLSIIMVLFVFVLIYQVKADNNKLFFVQQDNKLVYESDIEDNVFMQHLNMIPGSKYTDEIEIENGTNANYTLYLKVEEVEQSARAMELLDSIDMKVYLDEQLIYDGKARGLNYTSEGINLQNAILLKEFASNDKSILRTETKLSEEYSDKNGNSSKINWVFYAQYDNNEPQIIENVPKTDANNNMMKIMSLIVLLIGVAIIIMVRRKK